MKRAELAHVLRAASDITRELEFLVVGSAAILGSYDDRRLPDAATRSREGDITPYRIQDREIIDRIAIHLGEGSRFETTHGYFADAVDLVTSKSPAGWEPRLVRYSPPDANGAVGYCLEPHDCVAAKLGAGRDKDYEFAEALLRAGLISRTRFSLASEACRETRGCCSATSGGPSDGSRCMGSPPLPSRPPSTRRCRSLLARVPSLGERMPAPAVNRRRSVGGLAGALAPTL